MSREAFEPREAQCHASLESVGIEPDPSITVDDLWSDAVENFLAVPNADIKRLLADPEEIEDFLDLDDGRGLDIDKSWHAIHFLLTGDAWGGEPPLDFIAAGGEAIGDVDVGYGPARAFTSKEVAAIAKALAPITVAKLFERWDPAAIRDAEIYAVDPDARADEEGYVGSYFDQLKAFIAAAAKDGLGLIIYVN